MTQESPIPRPLIDQDLFAITVASDPKVSPDGSLLAWVQTRPDRESDQYRGTVWVSGYDGTNPRQLTNGAQRDGSPRWSPDSRTIAFISNRSPALLPRIEAEHMDKGKEKNEKDSSGPATPISQVWTISVNGGEAVQRSNHQGGASQPAWSPDGQAIAYVGKDKAEPGTNMLPPTSVGPIADERVVNAVTYRFDSTGFRDAFNHVWTVSLASGDERQLTRGWTNDADPAWSPDGTTIAFSGNRSEQSATTWNRSQLLSVPAMGGDVAVLAPEDASFYAPQWSPNGSRITFLGHLGTDSGKNTHLWTINPDRSDLTDETAAVDVTFSDEGMSDVHSGSDAAPQWLDESTIRLLGSARGETQVYEVKIGSGKAQAVTCGEHRISGFAAYGSDLVVLKGTISTPFALEHWHARDFHAFQSPNQEFTDTVQLQGAVSLNVTSADGTEIQGWIIPPHGFDPAAAVRHPMIVEIHGGPHAMYSYSLFHEMQLMAARGYAVAFCNPRGSSGYGEAFTTCTRGVWGESDMPDVIALTEAAAALPWIDPDRIGITGGSYGGYLTNWIIGHDQRFKAAVTQRCVSSFVSFFGTSDIGTTFGVNEFDGLPWSDHARLLKHSPIAYVDKITTPLLILHSERDLRCPIEQAEQMFVSLKYLNREVKFVRIPEEGHDLSRSGTPSRRLARLHHMIEWFDTHL